MALRRIVHVAGGVALKRPVFLRFAASAPRLTEDVAVEFRALGLRAELAAAVESLGLNTTTGIQTAAFPLVAGGHDAVLGAGTGTGKTLAYLLPVLQQLKTAEEAGGSSAVLPHRPPALVLVPSHELALQVLGVLKALAHHAKFRSAAISRKKVPDTPLDIVVSTPSRLLEARKRNQIFLSAVQHVVLDEVDTLLDPSFESETLGVLLSCKPTFLGRNNPNNRNAQCIAVGATLKAHTVDVLQRAMPEAKWVMSPSLHTAPASIRHKFVQITAGTTKFEALVDFLRYAPYRQIMIFVNKIETAVWLGRTLQEGSVACALLHGGLPRSVRMDELFKFRSGALSVLVCTDIASRGIDLEELDCVVMYDFPKTVSEYLHRAGRTGRAGKEGFVVSLVSKGERKFAHAVRQDLSAKAPQQGLYREAHKRARASKTKARLPAPVSANRSRGSRTRR
eukprot:m.96581 g.96581  ORF g.96581 m.96581 type:complete len:451 (+) comp8796_c0_seq1:100-1452(+)